MKTRLIFCLASFLFFVSCNTTQKLYESKSYDEVIDLLSNNARRGSISEEQLSLLTNSYHQANERDHERIIELKTTGQPDIWVEIYDRFQSIQRRQEKVNYFTLSVKKSMNYQKLDLDSELMMSKEKASLYLAAKAKSLLNENASKDDVNQAVILTNKLVRIDPHNKDLDRLRLDVILRSSSHILMRVAVPYNSSLSKKFKNNLFAFERTTINEVPFDTVVDDGVIYDLMIRVKIEKAEVSPERIDAVTFNETQNGLSAIVTDKTLSKTATIQGKIEYVDMNNNTVRLSTPFDITSTFKYNYAEVSGDKNACSQQTLSLLRDAVDFPSNESLFNDTGRKLRDLMTTMWF